jgi:hypothetical protein
MSLGELSGATNWTAGALFGVRIQPIVQSSSTNAQASGYISYRIPPIKLLESQGFNSRVIHSANILKYKNG